MRKQYEKPRIEKVKLVLKEVVLAGCKMLVPGTFGPHDSNYCGGYGGTWWGMCKDATS